MIGFDIGGTKCAVSCGSLENGLVRISCRREIPTDTQISPYEMIDRMCALAEEMTDDLSRIGISCGGPLDAKRGVILSPPNLPGWDRVEIVSYLEKKYNGYVRLENDANACALAEWRFGAGRGSRSMIFLTFGTGMGAGIVLNGKIYGGANGNAGEVGHVRLCRFGPVGYGKEGSFEGFASGAGIAMMAKNSAIAEIQQGRSTLYCKSMNELDRVTAKTVAEAARVGDRVAQRVYQQCGEMLGYGLSMLVDILNPEKILLGSIYRRASDLLEEPMRRVLAEECLPASLAAVTITAAALGEELGDLAALSLACNEKDFYVKEEN
ncbi:MAG: ROK family protein [Clostridia bacterium]|nr:ROK family protein [Clostridia bacterium]